MREDQLAACLKKNKKTPPNGILTLRVNKNFIIVSHPVKVLVLFCQLSNTYVRYIDMFLRMHFLHVALYFILICEA